MDIYYGNIWLINRCMAGQLRRVCCSRGGKAGWGKRV